MRGNASLFYIWSIKSNQLSTFNSTWTVNFLSHRIRIEQLLLCHLIKKLIYRLMMHLLYTIGDIVTYSHLFNSFHFAKRYRVCVCVLSIVSVCVVEDIFACLLCITHAFPDGNVQCIRQSTVYIDTYLIIHISCHIYIYVYRRIIYSTWVHNIDAYNVCTKKYSNITYSGL